MVGEGREGGREGGKKRDFCACFVRVCVDAC